MAGCNSGANNILWNPERMKFTLCLLLSIAAGAAVHGQTWVPQTSGTTASLRGVSAVNANIVWASGSGGTWLRTDNGGLTWAAATVSGAEELDFRGVRAIDGKTAWLLSSGPGAKSRIYKTVDGGRQWKLLFTNPDAQGFFDAIAFWDSKTRNYCGRSRRGADNNLHHRRWWRTLVP